jgi:hypothetical protein
VEVVFVTEEVEVARTDDERTAVAVAEEHST